MNCQSLIVWKKIEKQMEGSAKRSREEEEKDIETQLSVKKQEIVQLEKRALYLRFQGAMDNAKAICPELKDIHVDSETRVIAVSFTATEYAVFVSRDRVYFSAQDKDNKSRPVGFIADPLRPIAYHHPNGAEKNRVRVNCHLCGALSKSEYTSKWTLFMARVYAAVFTYFQETNDMGLLTMFDNAWVNIT